MTTKYLTTPALEKLNLYWVSTDLINFEMYRKSRNGKFVKKTVYKNTHSSEYIKHLSYNYSLDNLYLNIFKDEPLKKGVSKTFGNRSRKKKGKLAKIIEFIKNML